MTSLPRTMMKTTTFPISALPLAAKPQLLIHSLTADTATASPKLFRTQVIVESPSIQRRARVCLSAYSSLLRSAHSCSSSFLVLFTSPMSPPFPYLFHTTSSLQFLHSRTRTSLTTSNYGSQTERPAILFLLLPTIPTPLSQNTPQRIETSH